MMATTWAWAVAAGIALCAATGVADQPHGLACTAVPTSLLTADAARTAGVPLVLLAQVEELDIAVDGADKVDPHLDLLKGGGGNLTREKVVASIARRFVILAGQEKIVPALGFNFPVFIEVIEFAQPVVVRKLEKMGARVSQRLKPNGTPFLTDNQNPYLHAVFGDAPHTLGDPLGLEHSLKLIPGVVETGLFVEMADEVIIANTDGTIERRKRPSTANSA